MRIGVPKFDRDDVLVAKRRDLEVLLQLPGKPVSSSPFPRWLPARAPSPTGLVELEQLDHPAGDAVAVDEFHLRGQAVGMIIAASGSEARTSTSKEAEAVY
jgi:hypothetical protein